jgi:hypothetical protein
VDKSERVDPPTIREGSIRLDFLSPGLFFRQQPFAPPGTPWKIKGRSHDSGRPILIFRRPARQGRGIKGEKAADECG